MRVVVDAFGGDNAPLEIVKGASIASLEYKTEITLTGDNDKIEQIKEEVGKNPRISLWSAKSAACLRYLKKTTPEFSISNEASLILEEAIKEKYPEIWKLFEE